MSFHLKKAKFSETLKEGQTWNFLKTETQLVEKFKKGRAREV